MLTSYNGWPASPDPDLIGVDKGFAVEGVSFPGGVKSGDVSTVLRYVVEQFHRNVEPLVPGWCWGYEFRTATHSPGSLSPHSSATAVDLNAPRHGDGASGTFTPAQVDWIRRILLDVGGVVKWGAWWHDEMHFEIAGTPQQVAAVAAGLPHTTPPPTATDIEQVIEGDTPVTDDELEKIAAKVWAHIIGGGGAGASLEEVRQGVRDANAKLSKLVDPRNGNVDGTG
jgi:hypothetical protein